MVKAQLSLIKSINTETFWMNADLCTFEHVRCSLRSLMQFLDGPGPKACRLYYADRPGYCD